MTASLRTACMSLLAALLPTMAVAALPSPQPTSSGVPVPGSSGGATTMDVDNTYDFEVWAADDEVVWVLTIFYTGGGSSVHTFATEAGAMDMAAWYAFHIVEFSHFDLEPQVQLEPPVFIERFDKLADAESLAAILESAGLVVDIRWVKEPRRQRRTSLTSTRR